MEDNHAVTKVERKRCGFKGGNVGVDEEGEENNLLLGTGLKIKDQK